MSRATASVQWGAAVVARLTAACLSITALSSCAAEEGARPFAVPEVRLSKSRVAIGAPLAVTYRFTVLPDAQPLARNYRVLAHFVDGEGELMWTDDHEPPTPSSAWSPGETIEYTRTVFVPIYPYIGQAAVYTGLYSPEEPERVPLQGEDDGLRAYRVATLELLSQSENIFVIFKDGWYLPESVPDNPLVEWQWTAREAGLSFRNPKTDITFYLHYDGRPDLLGAPQQVTLTLDGNPIESFAVDSREEQIRQIAITDAQLGSGDVVELRIIVDPTFVPTDIAPAKSEDTRELGIRVFHAFVEPSEGLDVAP